MNYQLDATQQCHENEMDFSYGLVELTKAIYFLAVVPPKDVPAQIEIIFEFSSIGWKSKESGKVLQMDKLD